MFRNFRVFRLFRVKTPILIRLQAIPESVAIHSPGDWVRGITESSGFRVKIRQLQLLGSVQELDYETSSKVLLSIQQ